MLITHTVTPPARGVVSVPLPARPGVRDPQGDPAGPALAVSTPPGARPSPTVAGPANSGDEGREAAAPSGEGLWGQGRSLDRAARLLNRLLEDSRRRLKFNVHEDTGRIWVQVIDLETNEVVKEIPPERYLDLVARIWELVGLLVDEHA